VTTPADDELDDWIEQMSGRRGPARRGPVDSTVRPLRQAISDHEQTADERVLDGIDTPDHDDRAWQRLRFRMRAEGLAPTRGWRPVVWLPSAAAAMLALVVGVHLYRVPGGDPGFDVVLEEAPRMRGGDTLEAGAADPEASARRLAGALAAQQVRSRVYLHERTATLVFEVSAEQVEAAQRAVREVVPDATIRAGVNRVGLVPR
jgi:hypothetical protein